MAITKQDALDYHFGSRPGKIEVVSTKPCLTPVSYTHLDVYKRQEYVCCVKAGWCL